MHSLIQYIIERHAINATVLNVYQITSNQCILMMPGNPVYGHQ